jgi:hypothetical protein
MIATNCQVNGTFRQAKITIKPYSTTSLFDKTLIKTKKGDR